MPLIFIAILGVYQVLLFFIHITVYETLAASFGWADHWIAILFALLSFSFISASVLAHRISNRIVRQYYAASSYWFGLVHFLFAGAVVSFFLEFILYRNNIYVSPALLGGISFGIFFFLHTYGTWSASRAQVVKVTVKLPHLPEAWRNKVVVLVSDIHLGNIWRSGFAKKVAKRIHELAPAAVFVGGDIYDGVRCDPRELIEPWKIVRPPHGVYAVSGNHEYYTEQTIELFAAMREVGMKLLDNEVVDLEGLQIVGVDWKAVQKRADYEKILTAIPIDRAEPAILLKHEPSHLDVAEKLGVSLELSGHTHAGQLFPLNFITRTIYKEFYYGLHRLGDMAVYTSSGVGTWGPPLRLGTKSEIVAITLT